MVALKSAGWILRRIKSRWLLLSRSVLTVPDIVTTPSSAATRTWKRPSMESNQALSCSDR